MVAHPDFLVGEAGEGRGLTLEEVEAGYENEEIEEPPPAVIQTQKKGRGEKNAPKEPTPPETVIHNDNDESSTTEKPKKWRVYTTLERRWKTLTGHGIDKRKVIPNNHSKGFQFQLFLTVSADSPKVV